MGFHESLAHELLTEEDMDGVKTTLVCPYIVDSGMIEGSRTRSGNLNMENSQNVYIHY